MLLILLISSQVFSSQSVKVGVLSHRGDAATLKLWAPTAEYLSNVLQEYEFSIHPLDFDEIEPAVANQEIDFLLVNPGIYVVMEVKHRISRIATMNNLVGENKMNVFGGVIFTSARNGQINSLSDLRNRSFMAVDETSLGGYQMAWRELVNNGIDPHADIQVSFGGIHDKVVQAVLSGKVDAGTVRTGILSSMAEQGYFDLSDIKVLNEKKSEGFPLYHSTSLYPEWPFSKLQHTPNQLAQRVAVALLEMDELEPAVQWGEYAGWTIPLEYQPVHDLLQQLQLSPYDTAKAFTILDVIKKYFPWLIVILLFIVVLATMTVFIYSLHRKLEESKYLLEQHHVQILNSVADGIYGVDLNGNSTFVNQAMEQITGWKGNEIIGHNQHELLHHTKSDGSPHPAHECPVYKTFVDDEARFVEEDLFWRKDGSSFPVEYTSNPVHDEQGNTVGSVVVFRDISLRKQSRAAERKYQEDLAHVARLGMMGEMASGLAHELNQPLTAIATNADACVRLMESAGDKSRVVEVLEKIGTQARHAGEVIKHLRQLVRKEKPSLSQVDVNKLIRDVILLIKSEIDKNNVTVRLELDSSLPMIAVQNIHIDQVLINLIKNGIDAMRHKEANQRFLFIETSVYNDNKIKVTIKDSGSGIPEHISDYLFTPFKTTKENGMGLGLSLSRGIISSHGGKLVMESTGSEGTVFSFTLPFNVGA
jgi:two-component system sensor histidine kinase TtrS